LDVVECAVSTVLPQHGAAKPMGAGVAAWRLLPQTAGFASNVSKAQGKAQRRGMVVPFQGVATPPCAVKTVQSAT